MASNENAQLYTFLTGLQVIRDRDERGLIIGYSIARSLLTSEFKSRGRQLQHDEVRSIYKGLEDSVTKCNANSGDHTSPHFAYLCELKVDVNPLIEQLCASGELPEQKILTLKSMMSSHLVGARNPLDLLRRDGLSLIELTKAKGPSYGTGNILKADYQTLKEVLER
ncbi:MAG: hypothetical protein ABIH82_00325 [Candidatus Woesearchaeota archaeon]